MDTYSSLEEQVALLPLADARDLLDEKEEDLARQIMGQFDIQHAIAMAFKLKHRHNQLFEHCVIHWLP